jgi:DNA-binding protein HU-beta
MNKSDLVNVVANEANLSKDQAKSFMNTLTDVITKELSNKGSVLLVGFGKFSTVDRKERAGRNPKTGEAIQIPAKTVAKFKAGKGLAEAVNV